MTLRKHLQHAIRALGADDLPKEITIAGVTYRRASVFKHDFFAATGLYQGPPGKIVLKLGRQARFLGLPLAWIGRLLVGHEARLYRLLDGIEGIPRFTGLWRDNAFAHEYVEGHQLTKAEKVNDEFFDRLTALIEELHRRDVAYVDMEKRENVLVGDDGRPYLIDFQISWHLPANRGGNTWPARLILKVLQDADSYHLLKHRRRQRPDQLTPEQWQASYEPPLSISWHRRLFRPFTKVRRKALRQIETGS
ncbi:MAG: hypothetical protein JXQ73_07245 [Phycisphaerae bacterium]|nr:hypothetical protein [Phycisphaerae bacterium]